MDLWCECGSSRWSDAFAADALLAWAQFRNHPSGTSTIARAGALIRVHSTFGDGTQRIDEFTPTGELAGAFQGTRA